MVGKIFKSLFLLLAFTSCKTLHIGGGLSYDSGTSGGCEKDSGASGQIFTEYYFTASEGLGVALELGPLGYTDCNDGDPLIHISPLLRYKKEVSPNLYLIPTAGYTFGPFVDEGWKVGFILRRNLNNHFFADAAIDYYSAFSEKKNAIKPGKSHNTELKIRVGYSF